MRLQQKRICTFLLGLALVLSTVFSTDTYAAKAPKLNTKVQSIQVGKTSKISIKNSQKKDKVKWSVANKKYAKISKSTKKYCKIKGVKKGDTKLFCTVTRTGRKYKLSCKIKVKKVTTKQTVQPTAVPNETDSQITPAPVQPTAAPTTDPALLPTKWVTTWGTAEEKCDLSGNTSAMPKLDLEGTTVRQIIRVTTTGEQIKFRLSNQYGKVPVVVKSMHIAKQKTANESTIDVTTDTVVTVDGKEEFTIPAGKVITTDAVNFSVEACKNIAISSYYGSTPTSNLTGHRGARATTYQVAGNEVSTATFSGPQKTTAWYFLADASLYVPEKSKAVVCFGDSITDGYGTDATYLGKKPDSYTRWEDYFANRLQANEATKNVSVINEGIGSNGFFSNYPTDAGETRFSRDLLEHDGIAYCIILFGVNNLNKLSDTTQYNKMLPEYQKMIKLCHDNNIKVYGAPILPFGTSSYYSDSSEEVRQMINAWMRSTDSKLDGIIDFESAVADPSNPKNILEKYTHSDGLHPYDGYEAMANAIDLSMFE